MARFTRLEKQMLLSAAEFVLAGEWPWDEDDTKSGHRKEARQQAALQSASHKLSGAARVARRKESSMTETVGSALPKEMARVRDELMPRYVSIGPAGGIALVMMRGSLDRAAVAMAEGDTVAMIRSLQELRDYKD